MHQETARDAATASFTSLAGRVPPQPRSETAVEISCSLDAEGRIRDISDNIEALYGWSRDAMIGRLFLDFVHPDDREAAYNSYRLRIAGQAHPAEQRRFLRPDGSSVDMSWSLLWMKLEQVCHCIGRTVDPARTGAANPIPDRIDAIGRLSGKVAHDFNNLLTVMLGCSEALASEIQFPRHRKLAELTLRAARRGRELTQRLLAVGQRQPLAPLAFDAHRLLVKLTPSIANIAGQQTRLDIVPGTDIRPVFADPAQTETALLN
ncbi:MAG: PAS domain S-box protein, partial [Alphaproteobacteria bacterium]